MRLASFGKMVLAGLIRCRRCLPRAAINGSPGLPGRPWIWIAPIAVAFTACSHAPEDCIPGPGGTGTVLDLLLLPVAAGCLAAANHGDATKEPPPAAAQPPTKTDALTLSQPDEHPQAMVTVPPPEAPKAHVVHRPDIKGPQACQVVSTPTIEAEYLTLREQLDSCWQTRVRDAQRICDKNTGAPGPPCYSAQDARKNRDAALAAFDNRWKQASGE
ncbi:MAG: hypothetical protein AB7S71_04705 [Dongiaceae bacterium]